MWREVDSPNAQALGNMNTMMTTIEELGSEQS